MSIITDEQLASTEMWQHTNSGWANWLENDFGIKETNTESYPFMQFRYVVIGIVFYLLTELIFSPSKAQVAEAKAKEEAMRPSDANKMTPMKAFVFLHNMILFVFSLLTCINVWPTIIRLNFQNGGFANSVCRRGWQFEFDGDFGFWAWAFYMSKYYEFIDTWIVIAKGRKPIFLQVFHHCGAVVGMWIAVVGRTNGCWIFVGLNSFIHTIMYAYYAYSTLGFKFRYKSIITRLQIVQFFTGNSLAVYITYFYYYHPVSGCPGPFTIMEVFNLVFNASYVFFLVILFNSFFKKTYRRPKEGSKQNGGTKESTKKD